MPENSPPLLEMRHITKTYPGVVALNNVTFTVQRGEVHCLVGENGAGKSTLIKILAGAIQADSGKIFLNGQPITITNPHQAQQLGLSFIFQELNVVDQLTVADNISLGRERHRFGWLRRHEEDFARAHLEPLGVNIDPRRRVSELSVAEKQMVEIARALSYDASIIVMDEPSAPLTEHELARLFEIIRVLKRRGVTIIYISHRLAEIFEIGDRVTVLRDGRHVATLNVAEATREQLVKLMVGRSLQETFPRSQRVLGKEVLTVKNVSWGNRLKDISFSVREGEIVGVAGLVGAGRTELARLIFGVAQPDAGQIMINGRVVRITSPRVAIRHGVGLVPEERRTEGIVGGLSVRENISMAAPHLVSTMGLVNRRRDTRLAQKFVSSLRIKTPSLLQKVRNLSGGNQQKTVVAKWLATNSKILLMDEPTRGIDVGAKAEMFALMDDLARQGHAILMFSSELEEILGMSDTILVMHRGRVVARLPREEATQERIMYYATGGGEDEQASTTSITPTAHREG